MDVRRKARGLSPAGGDVIEYFDLAERSREQSHIAREHARYSQQERSYDLAWLVLTLAMMAGLIAVMT